tara:strand:+ start:106 stop:393 length:288 start_codon:yes stop_codon:yes gene_type:complete
VEAIQSSSTPDYPKTHRLTHSKSVILKKLRIEGVNNMTPEQIFGIVFATLFVFLLMRELFCWYFKINKRVKLLSDIKDELIAANKISNDLLNVKV